MPQPSSANRNPPVPLTLRRYQQQGVDFLANRDRACLFDCMGLGKTPQALRAALAAHARRTVIVCPLATAPGWVREIEAWAPSLAPYTVILRRNDPWPTDLPANGADRQVIILPYTDLAHRFGKPAKRGPKPKPPSLRSPNARPPAFPLVTPIETPIPPIDLLIVDEAHTLRNGYATKMGQGFHTLAKCTNRIWFLTGTPMPNGRPYELLPLLQLSQVFKRPNAPLTATQYQDQFCRQSNHFAPDGYDYLGAKNLPQLSTYLQSLDLILQRLPQDVPGELPDLQRTILPLAAPLLLASLEEKSVRRLTAAVNSELPPLEDLSAYRAALATSKAEMVADYLRSDVWPTNEPAAVFCHHQEAGQLLARKLGCKFASGKDSPVQRQAKVDEFALPTGPQFLVASMAACGTGMNGMQRRTANAIFAECAWDLGTIDQAEGRVRRIGSIANRVSQAIYCVVADAFEEVIMRTVITKRNRAEKTFASGKERSVFANVPPSTRTPPASVSHTNTANTLLPPSHLIWSWQTGCLPGERRKRWFAVARSKAGPLPTDPQLWRGAPIRAYHQDGWANKIRLGDCVLRSSGELWFSPLPL